MTRVPIDLLSALKHHAEALASPGVVVRSTAAKRFAETAAGLYAWKKKHRVRTLVDDDLHESMQLAARRFGEIRQAIKEERAVQANRARALEANSSTRLVIDSTGYANIAPSASGGSLLLDIEPDSRLQIVDALCFLIPLARKGEAAQKALTVIRKAMSDENAAVREKAAASSKRLPLAMRWRLRK